MGNRHVTCAVRAIPALVLSVVLTGCIMVGPDFVPPTAPRKANFIPSGQAGSVTERREPTIKWWERFNDHTLNHLVALAYRENLTLRAAGVRIYEARAQLGIVIGDQYPQQQTAGAQYKYERVSRNVGLEREVTRFFDFDPTFHNWSVGFDAGWELDLWGKVRRGVQSADANLVAKVADYDDILITVTGDVATAYVTIRELQAELALVRRNVRIQEASLRIARTRFQAGVVTELDVDEATALLNDTKAEVPKILADLDKAKNALAVLLGKPAGEIDALISDHGSIPNPPPGIGVGVPVELLLRRPDLRAAQFRAAAQAAKIGVAKADLYPQLGISGAIGVKASDLANLFDSRSLAGVINPGITWNVLNYGRIRNNVRVQDARYQALIVEYQQSVLKAYAEVEDALSGFFQAQQQAVFLARSANASRRAQRVALDQYEDGTVAYTRVLDNQAALLRAEQRLTAARADAATNLIAVYKGLGGGWEAFRQGPYIPEAMKEEMAKRTNWGKLLEDDAIPQSARNLRLPPKPQNKPDIRAPDW